jgi:PAS domain S-box-containing protein
MGSSIREYIMSLLEYNDSSIFIVNNDNHLKGSIIKDAIIALWNELKDDRILEGSINSFISDGYVSIDITQSLMDALSIMVNKKLEGLPVIKKGLPVGTISKESILSLLYPPIIKNYENILNTLHESVCVVDKDGVVILWSKGSEKLLGFREKEILGKNIKDFFPNALLLRVLQEKKEMKNYYHSPKDGRYVVVSAMPIYNDGEFVGAVSTDKDADEITNLIFELEEEKDKFQRLQREVNLMFEGETSFEQVLGHSNIIKDKIIRAKQVSKTNASVLIIGESGTGKEVFARAIHKASGRKGLFIPVNCSAIPETLFESEMFGYEGGAFTGALKKGKLGKFELAHEGTLFFDEIGDMPLYMQAKLLRALQERRITRVGAEKSIDVDVRIISATNRDLRKMVIEGSFREDLYYRLNVVEINLPPLRERKEDIPSLALKFISDFCHYNNIPKPELTPEILVALTQYDWKGNIRELKNIVENLVIFSRNGRIKLDTAPEFLFSKISKEEKNISATELDLKSVVNKTELEIINKILEEVKGNKSKAAKILNIPRTTLIYKLKGLNKR